MSARDGQEEQSVAVILPTYNRARFLPTALYSLTKQTIQPKQIVVVNDGSTDQTSEIIEGFAKDVALDVTEIDNPTNLGIGYSRQVGAEAVREDVDYLSYISDDDTWHSQFLERMLSRAAPGCITYCQYETVDLSSGRVALPFKFPTFRTQDEFLRTALVWSLRLGLFVNFSCLLIPRTIAREVPFRRELRKGEDLAFLLDSLCNGVDYSLVGEVLVRASVHPAAGYFHWNLDERRRLLAYVTRRLSDLGVSEDMMAYAMNDQRRWARLGRDEPIRRIRRLPVSVLLHLPPTRAIGQILLRHDREALDRRVAKRLETVRLGASSRRVDGVRSLG